MRNIRFYTVLQWLAVLMLGLAFVLPFKSCSHCLTPAQLIEKKIPQSEWNSMKKGRVDKIDISGKAVTVDCYWHKEYFYAYDDTINLVRGGEIKTTAFLFICFFWPLPFLVFLVQVESSRVRRYMLMTMLPLSLGSSYWLFMASVVGAESGAVLSLISTAMLFVSIIIELVMRRKELFPGREESPIVGRHSDR